MNFNQKDQVTNSEKLWCVTDLIRYWILSQFHARKFVSFSEKRVTCLQRRESPDDMCTHQNRDGQEETSIRVVVVSVRDCTTSKV